MIFDELKNIKSSKQELRKFGLTVGTVLLIIGTVLYFLSKESYSYFLISGIFLCLAGIFIPKGLLPIQKVWMGLAVILGWFSTRIILSILFYLVFTPIRFIAKLFGKEFLELKLDKQAKTYWNYREQKEFNPTNYEHQF